MVIFHSFLYVYQRVTKWRIFQLVMFEDTGVQLIHCGFLSGKIHGKFSRVFPIAELLLISLCVGFHVVSF